MIPLPIDSSLPQIVDALRSQANLVIVAPPGAGKTTRVGPAVLRAGVLGREHPHIVMLQPRRVAARAAAERIAEENRWELGREVGYHIRFDKRVTEGTRLRVLTEGILTRQLLESPFLEGVGMVVLDEFHERNLHTDLAVAFLREIQQTVRTDLKIVVMSATLEAEPIAAFLGGAAIVRTEGRAFAVEVSHRPIGDLRLPEAVARCVGEVVEAEAGDVLVFLPGVEEIRRAQGEVERLGLAGVVAVPLHGSLTSEEQHRALRPATPERAGMRKVILATNIAETSLTIEGVRTVIDSGLVRVAGFDADRGMDRLDLQRISRASATQRAGRAGRTAPGRCIRLWSAAEDRNLEEFEVPEVMRVDLAGTVLGLHAWGAKDPRQFGWFEKPPEAMLAAAEGLLELLGAVAGGRITALGRQMLGIPAHPRVARLLIEAARMGVPRQGATIAALLSERDILRRAADPRAADPRARGARSKSESDLLVRLEVLERFAREEVRDADVDQGAVRQVLRVRGEFYRLAEGLRRSPPTPPTAGRGVSDEELLRLPLFAFPDRVVRRRGNDASRGIMVGGGGIKLAAESAVLEPELFLALDLRHDDRSRSGEAMVSIASGIRREWLEESFPQALRRVIEVEYDAERQRVVGVTREFYRDLLLREDPNAVVSDAEAAQVLAEALRPQAEGLFRGDEACASLLARVELLRKAMPERGWPVFDGGELAEILAGAAPGKRSLAEIRRAGGGNLVNLLRGRLVYPLDRRLEEHAPETLEVPSGSRIRLEYGAGQAPVLAVRLQELFGWTDTPRIAAGRVAVTIHLLGPNYRPVQVTSDLRSFWKSAYFEVRKDLRARYPKHSWPEDPLTAKAEAKAKGRRRGQ